MKRPSSIILVSIDSLRADHLGCYGYPRDTSPFIDKLANQGVLFKNAFSTCSYTVPSHASMFTGKYPSNHSIGFHQKFPKFNKDIDISLAELLASQGYYNIGIVGAMVLRKEIGLDAGFHIYDSEIHDGRRCGDNVNQLFEESLQKALATDKYNGIFGFLHFFDVHLPYVPPHAYKDLFIGDRFYHCYPTDLDIVKDGWGYEGEPVQIGGIPRSAVLQKEDGTLQTNANFYVSQYDACIKYVDDCVRKLITLLKRFGIYDHSVIIITSDHGEAMGENDVWFYHSLTVTPDQIHVPLIIKLPKYYNVQGRVVETPVSLVDLFPTVCDLIGFDWTKIGVDGRSLLQLILKGNDQGLEDRTFISEIEGQISRINRNGITVEPKEANRKDFVFFYVEELCKLRQKFALGKSRTPLIGWTGERYVPWVDLETPEIHYEHLHRYYFASQFVAGKKVLDLASGEGYGCAILSEKAAQVVGIDLDQKTIEHATNRYPLPNVQFIEGTIIDVPIKGEKLFDVITCFEAIEHIEEHEKLLSEVKRLLKDDGIFIISSPNKLLYTDQPGYQNPYHMKELYFDEFRNLLTKYFTYVSFLGQKVFPVSAIWPLETHQGSYADFCIRKTGKGFASANPQEKPALYFIAIASQAPLLHEVHFSTLTDISEELLKRLRYMLAEKERLLSEKNTELLLIYSSFGWRIIQRYRAVADRLFPGGTKRRQLYELTSKSLKVLLTEGPFELAKKIKGWFKGRRELRNPRPTMIKKSLFRKVSLLTDRFEPFSFPANDQPKASIIIPVYNKWLYTYNCLRSIANNTSDVPYEVIVVDNASEDETGEWLDRIENLVVIKNNENEGFIKACNKGAGAARGEFLVFLNNDTVVLPGWLSALIGTLQGEPSVGAVGAKLLYPDGRLQEAGGIIWNDASGWNYGRNDSPDKSEYNFVREVDYCSGACLAIKKEIFKSCNGFDERYYPAYFEDTDLCFTVRKLGYKVLYQPKAEIVHFEGITAGRDESAGVKSFQRINKPKFYEKWQPVLQEKHWPPDPDLAWRARRHGKKPEVLIMDHHMPTYDKDSGSFRMWNIIKLFLELGWNVTFYPDNLVPLEPYTSQLQQIGVEVIYGSTTFKNFLSQRRLQFDVVLLARPDFSFPKVDLVRQLLPRTKIIYDTVDLHFLREQRRAEIEGSREARLASERYKAMELYLVKTSDVTFVVTEDERKHLLNLDPNLNVAIIPNIHPLPERKPPAFENRSGIMFVGSYLHPPNVDGVKWFVAEIWPKIRQKIPDIVFYVIGSNVPKDILRLEKEPGVKVIGWVPNVEPWFDRCRVFVSPLRYGAGMKGKIGHAMSYGLPVVTTSVGAEGMGLKDRENALIRDNPEEFTQAVVELYESRNLWEKIEENALEHIHINYTPKVIRERLSLILRDLARPTRNLSSDYH